MKKTTSISGPLIGIAGVHHVAAELSRRGLIALPTIRNTAGYDIIAMTPNGRKHANIQVKTSQNKVGFWPMPSSDKVCTKPNDYYIFLRWLQSEEKFEGFMLTGSEAKKAVIGGEQRPVECQTYPYNPIGFLIHELKNVKGKESRDPCP